MPTRTLFCVRGCVAVIDCELDSICAEFTLPFVCHCSALCVLRRHWRRLIAHSGAPAKVVQDVASRLTHYRRKVVSFSSCFQDMANDKNCAHGRPSSFLCAFLPCCEQLFLPAESCAVPMIQIFAHVDEPHRDVFETRCHQRFRSFISLCL